jgi:hypothetical protein
MESIKTINFHILIVFNYNASIPIFSGAIMFSEIISEILDSISCTLADYGQCKG